jgi:dCTP deaminase
MAAPAKKTFVIGKLDNWEISYLESIPNAFKFPDYPITQLPDCQIPRVVDSKHFDERSFVTVRADCCVVPPNSFALARSVEYFKIPRDVLTICLGKSTYARRGVIVNVTPFEPEWEGFVTLEISNTTPLPARIYAHEGLCQIIFFQSDEVCEVSYADRKGKYQAQKGIVLPKL